MSSAGNIIRDAVSGAPYELETRAAKKITEVQSSVITYTGWTLVPGAAQSAPVWRISKTTRNGDTTTVEYAGQGDYKHAWDDRATLFEQTALTNNYSTLFDGINDYVNLGTSAWLYDVSNQWSISMYVWIDNLSAIRTIFSRVEGSGTVHGISMRHETSGYLSIQFRSSGGLTLWTSTTTALAAQTWYHLTFTYNGTQNLNGWRAYVNAVSQGTPASAACTGSINLGQPAMLGARNGAQFFSGYIDQVTVWDKALAASEVTSLYNGGVVADPSALSFSSSLVSWLKMGDGDAYPTLLDSVGTTDGTMTNMVAGSIAAFVQ